MNNLNTFVLCFKLNQMTKSKRYTKLDKPPVIDKLCDVDFSSTYSYANYLRWRFDERLELIRGKVFEMAAPSVTHQRLLLRLAVDFDAAIKGRNCETFIAPFDVRLPNKSKANKDIYTVVQPDICVVCDQNKLDAKGCIGTPDLIVEILSPGNSNRDLKVKYELYEEFGVKEYLIIDPERNVFLKYNLNKMQKFELEQAFKGDEVYTSAILPGMAISPDQIFRPRAA